MKGMKGNRKLLKLSREYPRLMLYILAKLSSGSYIRKNKEVVYTPTKYCGECGQPKKYKKKIVTAVRLINSTFPYLDYIPLRDYQVLLKYRLVEQLKYSSNHRLPKRFVIKSILIRR